MLLLRYIERDVRYTSGILMVFRHPHLSGRTRRKRGILPCMVNASRFQASPHRFLAAGADDVDHSGELVFAAAHGPQALEVVQGPPRAGGFSTAAGNDVHHPHLAVPSIRFFHVAESFEATRKSRAGGGGDDKGDNGNMCTEANRRREVAVVADGMLLTTCMTVETHAWTLVLEHSDKRKSQSRPCGFRP